jgi:hypothetical protein
MSNDLRNRTPAVPSRPLDLNASPSALVIWGLAFLLIYGYELFNFSLSIDEELHTFDSDWSWQWLQQGRWGMALLSWSLPPISALPVASTALFGAGLLFAVIHLTSHYRLQGLSAHLFGVVLIACPIWPHIAEFNSLSYGIGIGLALCVVAVRLLDDPRRRLTAVAVAALVLAAGIYQTLLLAAIVMALGRYFLEDRARTGNFVRRMGRDIALIVVAGILSSCLQYGAMRALNVQQSEYANSYWRVWDYAVNPLAAGTASAKSALGLVLGTSRVYLGYGLVIVVLPLTAFGYSLFRDQAARFPRWLTRVSVLAIALLASFLPVFVSAGTLPARGILAFPFVVALTAACFPVATLIERWMARIYLLMVTLLAVTISAQLFYSDHLARARDLLLAGSLLERLQQLRPADKPLRVTLFGSLQGTPIAPVKQVEVFGNSFFGQDGGSIWRVTAYFQILGVDYLQAVDLSPDIATKASAMPPWPSPGAVALVDGTAVIKLGPISYDQRGRLCSTAPDHSLCR